MSVGEKCNWQHSMAHPRKNPTGAKISQKSLTQAELQPFLSQISLPGRRLVNDLWTFSIQEISPILYGDQTTELYSKIGLT